MPGEGKCRLFAAVSLESSTVPDTKKGIDTGDQRGVNVIKETNRVKRTGHVRGLVASDSENRGLWGKASRLFLRVPETKNGFYIFYFLKSLFIHF